MTISYPLALPAAAGFARIVVRDVNIVAVSASPYTGEAQVYEHQGKWWEADIDLPPLKADDAAEWESFLAKLKGMRGTFLLGDPAKATPRGIASGAPAVNGAHAALAGILFVSAGVNNVTNWLKAGDHVQIGSGASARLHMNLSDASTDGSGNAALDVWPTLRDALSGGEAITLSSPKGVFRLAQNQIEKAREPGIITRISFKAIEDI